ncbi:hypothetical protein J2Y02_001503 [Neobacillus drentensis]|nr:hypothetical protein [Neobacillus drentensis]
MKNTTVSPFSMVNLKSDILQLLDKKEARL